MRILNLVFLSFGTFAAGFSITGVPSTATVNVASTATLIRTSGDPTSFSLLLRLVQQNGGDTIQTFNSEQGTNIPFTFTPTQTGSFIIEVISNLEPISTTQEPDKIFAGSPSFTVVASDQPPPSTTSSSSSENAGTTSSSQNTNTASSTNTSGSQTTVGSSNGKPEQGSATTSTSSSKVSGIQLNGSTSAVASSTTGASTTTNGVSTGGGSGQGALATGSGTSPTSTSNSGSSDSNATQTGGIGTSPGSTGTSVPSGTTSKSSKTGMIVGILFGVLAFVAICLILFLAYIRYRRRKRTSAFERQLMFRPVGSSPLIFSDGALSSNEGGDGSRGYAQDSDMVERGRRAADPQSVYSEQSVPSVYSDSPSIFYTAVPRAVGTSISNDTPAPSTLSSALPLPPVPIPTHGSGSGLQTSPSPFSPSDSTTASVASASASAPASALPQLAPGWVFPRNPTARRSQLPPPKTDRQMDIYDRKVRLQGKLIGMQGWGNMHASESEKAEMAVLKEQIRRLDLLESSDWALGKSDELPAELL